MICASSRSGSTYLCELLASTGVLAQPQRSGLSVRPPGAARHHPDKRRDRQRHLRRQGHRSALLRIEKRIDPFRDLPNLALVRLRRMDVVGQAISLTRVRQTGQFVASDRPRGAAAYDAQAIRDALQSIAAQEAI
jgi:LPS sulfotransferase NodH